MLCKEISIKWRLCRDHTFRDVSSPYEYTVYLHFTTGWVNKSTISYRNISVCLKLKRTVNCDLKCWYRLLNMDHIVDTCPLTKFEGGVNLLHKGQVRYWSLTSLNITQMISDNSTKWMMTQSYGWILQRLQQLWNKYINTNLSITNNLTVVLWVCADSTLVWEITGLTHFGMIQNQLLEHPVGI